MEKRKQMEKRRQLAQTSHNPHRRKSAPESVRKGKRRRGAVVEKAGGVATIGRAKKKVVLLGGGGKFAFWIAVGLFVLSLLPLLWASFYTHTLREDFSFGIKVHRALQAGGGVLDVIRAAINVVKDNYHRWQGTFSAIFIFSLMPGVFSEDLYFLTTFIMLSALVFSTLYLIWTIVVRWLRGDPRLAVLIALGMLFEQIQFVPYINEAFFWFNGSSYYTLFYSFLLVLIGLVIRIVMDKGRIRGKRLIPALFLAMMIGGGNYCTALFSFELLVISALVLGKLRNRAWKQVAALALVVFGCLTISAIAPGNMNRMAENVQLSPLTAIARSIQRMVQAIDDWTRLPQLVYFALIAPILYFLSLKCNWQFRWPIVVLTLAFLLTASQMTPPYFAMSFWGKGRLIDMYYYSYYLMLTFCEFYLCGWLARRRMIANQKLRVLCRRYFLPYCVTLMFLFVMSSEITSMSSVVVGQGLLNGEPQRYDQDYSEFRELLIASDGDVRIPFIETPSYFEEPLLMTDPEHWINRVIADYYDLHSVAWQPAENSGE